MRDDTVHRLLEDRAAQDADKLMLIDPADRMTYARLDATSRGLAAGFIDAGVGKGTRVGLIMPNGVRWAQTALALMRIGAVLVPLSTLLQARELVTHLRVASVQFLIAVEQFRGHRYLDELRSELAAPDLGAGTGYCPALPALRQVCTAEKLATMRGGDGAARVVDAMAESVSPSDTLVILFTSGSSGPPKGVVHSHGSAIGAVRSGLADRCVEPDSRLYLPMPFFWTGGFAGGMMTALVAGATLVTEPVPRPQATLRLLERERVTLFRGRPDQAEALARQSDATGADLSALRPGSLEAMLPPAMRAQPGARANLFGMTESFGPYCGYRADTDMPRSAWRSCGKPFEGMDVRIIDPSSGQPPAAGAVGEIQLRGPHILRGICRRSREDVFTVDGFYPTGDLGRFDDDGFLFYHGRSDDMFRVRGASVYPSEVEQALRTIDGVKTAFVTNVGDIHGEHLAAMVVCDTATTTAEELRSSARAVLSSFKVPTVWLLTDSDDAIPRGSTGKVDIRRLREMLTGAQPLEASR
ncbi:class I adenylate-forming enzyme family protein [Mycobacterium sp.]|uniref:class I adenylate-forming enzyme family protein n=1 Tax=Mycobacterium sp. TaxID=1785 RepID=UPI002C907CAC|nr:class I adenylate-forming enzyme family protein [Mycobacterium sp.]HME49251.1 class I adenylate-forming enzyme family protein [Mycobacterium sp.]